jgi:hypothetical protein
MSNQDNPSGHHDDSDQGNANARPRDVSNGIERQANSTGPMMVSSIPAHTKNHLSKYESGGPSGENAYSGILSLIART